MTDSRSTPHGGPCENTDREIYREREGDYYADSIHVTEGGGIGINCGGMVYVKPLREWHKLAGGEVTPAPPSAVAELKKLTNSDDWNNAVEWNGDISGMRRRLTWLLDLAEQNASQLDNLRKSTQSESAAPDYRKCFTALVTLLPMAKAAIPHPRCTVAYAASIAQADQAIHEALHPETPHVER
jgi:hypothetical protein